MTYHSMRSTSILFLTALFCAWPVPASAGGINPPSPTDEGRALLKSRAYHLAMERFLLVEEKSESTIERALAMKLIGETQFHEKDYAAAYQAYQQSLRLNPLTTGALGLEFRSAVSLVYLKNYKSAIAKFKGLEKRAFEPDTRSDLSFWEAECHFQLEEYGEAGTQYGKILEENPKYRYANLVRYLQAWCFYQKEDYEKALEGFSSALASTGPKETTLRRLNLFQLAETHFRLGRFSAAQKTYEEFLKVNPDDPLLVPALYGLGWSFEKQKAHTQAAETFEKIWTKYPKHPLAPWATVRHGAEAYLMGDGEQARKVYARGLELASDKAPADLLEYGLGWLDYSDKKYDAAELHFSAVARFAGESELHWDARYLQAGCQYLQDKYYDAKEIYGLLATKAPQELAEASSYWLGWCDYALGKYDLARENFRSLGEKMTGDLKTRAYWGAAESAYQSRNYTEAIQLYEESLKGHPAGSLALECYSGLGWSHFQREKYEDAVEAFQKAAHLDPRSVLGMEAQLRTGDCYYNLHEYEKAEPAYQLLLDRKAGAPYELDAQEQLGWCAYRQGKFPRAVEIWRAALQKGGVDERKSRLIYWTAWAHFRGKDFESAASTFKKVEEGFPKDPLAPEAHLREADCLFNLQKFKESKGVYQSFLEKYPNHPLVPDALYGFQWSSEKLGEKKQSSQAARNFLEKFPSSPFAAGIQYRLAESLLNEGKSAQAVDAYKALLQKYPDSPEAPRALFWMGTAMVKKGAGKDAIPVFQELLKKYPTDPLALEGQFSLGSLYFEDGNFKAALGSYTDIFENYPTHRLAPHSLFNSAICEKQLKHLDKSLAYYQKLMADYGNDPLALEAGLQVGLLLEKNGRREEAAEAYEKTMRCSNESLAVEASFYRADLYRQEQKYDLAIRDFNRLIIHFPSQDQWAITAFAKIAECYETQKQYSKAAEAYKQILTYTKIKTFREATLKRLKALEPLLKEEMRTATPAATPVTKKAPSSKKGGAKGKKPASKSTPVKEKEGIK